MRLNIHELSEKYQLHEWIVEEEIEKAVSEILTKRMGFEIEALFNNRDNSLELWGFILCNGDLEVRKMVPGNLRKSLMHEIKYGIVYALMKRSVLEDYEQIKDRVKSVTYGSIIRIQPCGTLHVDIPGVHGRDSVLAVCDPASQTPRERGTYRTGDSLSFSILSIYPVDDRGTPRLEVKLSRNSKALVEGLLREEIKERKLDIHLMCIKRIAGAFSEVLTSERIPRECIKGVSNEIKERIIVTYGKEVEECQRKQKNLKQSSAQAIY